MHLHSVPSISENMAVTVIKWVLFKLLNTPGRESKFVTVAAWQRRRWRHWQLIAHSLCCRLNMSISECH